MNRQRPVVAAFDVDGTLTTRDCVRPFLVRLGGYRTLAGAALGSPIKTAGAAFRRDRDAVKELAVGAAYNGRLVDEVRALGESFADMIHESWLRADTVARLRWHQRSGHHTVIVSASLDSYLVPLADRLGIEGVLCTSVGRAGDRYTAQLAGPNCRADEKRRRLDTWLEAEGLADAEVWAYGDSRGDAELLDRADHPALVRNVVLAPEPIGVSG